MMKKSPGKYFIASMEDLKKEQDSVRLRIIQKEKELASRMQQVPGEIFYSGMDRVIPDFLTGRVSSFALNAGKGLVNNFFVRKAVTTGGLKFLTLVKPSGILRKLHAAYSTIRRKK